MMIRRLELWVLCAACLCSIEAIEGASGETAQEPIALGTARQLLFDNMFLEKSEGITLRVISPVQEPEPVLVADRPWERGGIGAYNTVMREDGKFRMWYDLITTDRQGTSRRLVCYAESADGIHWEKPEVGLIEFDGSAANNMVAPPEPGASQQGASVMRDDRALPVGWGHNAYRRPRIAKKVTTVPCLPR